MTEDDIYRYYLGEVVIGAMYNSPIPGRRDRTPSFQLYEKDGRIRWIDHGLTDQYGRDVENLVQYLRYLPLTGSGYGQAKRLIKSEVQPGMIGMTPTRLTRRRPREVAPYVSQCDYRDFELAYWGRFEIDKRTLLHEDIQPLESMSWAGEHGATHMESTPESPAFVYWWRRSPDASWKIYRPMAPKKDRFRQENPSGVIEGWNSMMRAHELSSKGTFDVMFIASSTKDRLTIKHAFDNPIYYNAINPRGEADRQDLLDRQDEINALADRVIVLYDADDAGYNGSQLLASLTGWETYDMRGKLEGEKDISDYIDRERGNHSYNELVDIIKRICNI